MTVAELAVLGLVLALLLWALRPLQRLVRNVVERWSLRGRHGKVIEGRFRSVPPQQDPVVDDSSGRTGSEPETKKDE